MNDELLKLFIKARDHIHNTIAQKIEVFLLSEFNPIVKYQLIREIINIIKNELVDLYPDLPQENIPNCKLRIFESSLEVGVSIQNYFNHESALTFLGSSEIGDGMYDYYYRESYDPNFKYVFIARFGNKPDDFVIGSKTAAAEYYLGQCTPLSMAFGIAIEEGFIG